MRVELLSITPLWVVVDAIRTCYDSLDKSDSVEYWYSDGRKKIAIGTKDRELIRKIIKNNHTSTLEHIMMTFRITDISRLCLIELSRHRISSFSVKSTRYTLSKDVKNKELMELFVSSGDPRVDLVIKETLEKIFMLKKEFKIKNDILKYALPEAFKTELVWSVNARSLRNFLQLRLSPRAHFEIRELAKNIVFAIPEKYHILFEDILNNGGEK